MQSKISKLLIASFVALGAASLAYASAQKVAGTQRATSIDLSCQLRLEAENKARRDELRLCLAISLEFLSDIYVVERVNNYRERFVSIIENAHKALEDETQLPFAQFSTAWKNLILSLGRMKKLSILKIETKSLGLFDPQSQRNVHYIASAARQSDDTFSDLHSDLKQREFEMLLGIEVKDMKRDTLALKAASGHVRSYLESKIQEIAKALEPNA